MTGSEKHDNHGTPPLTRGAAAHSSCALLTLKGETFWIDRPLVLVGTMGAGKTSIGRRLAKKLALPFFDSDAEFEAAAGCSIIDYFDRFGESAFRAGEAKIIGRMIDENPIGVIATGGGALKTTSVREKIYHSAITLWMRADLDTLVKRVSRRNTRPLLNRGDPREILSHFSQDEAILYSNVDVTINSHADAVMATVNAALEELYHFLSTRS